MFSLSDLETSEGRTAPPAVLHTAFPSIIDNTAREQFCVCPRKFAYSSIGHLTPIRKSIHLHAGGAYAAGLETMRRAFYDSNLSAEDSLEAGVVALIKFYGSYEPLESDLKTCERMVGALLSYAQQYPLATDYLKPYRYTNSKSAIEFTFAIPLEECLHPVTKEPIIYAGRFDMLAVRDGVLYVVDDKTTSQLGPLWGNQWDLNSQFTGYVWAARQFGLPVAAAVVRGQSILKSSYGHAQHITYRPQWLVDRWYKQLVRNINAMITAWENQYFDYALGSACSAYSGCEFKTLCTSNEPERHIAINYTERHWNPTEKDPEAPLSEKEY